MRILLITTPIPDAVINKDFALPTSVLYLAASLREHGISAAILDMNVDRTVLNAIERFKPSFVGISCLFSGQFPYVRELARTIKAHNKNLPIVIGGLHPTIYAREILEHCREIDYVILGEGEHSFVQLLRGDMNRDGVAYRVGKAVIVEPKLTYIEKLDSLPFPAYDLVNFEDYYLDTSHWWNPKGLPFRMYVPIISSRSCPRRCTFCSMFHTMGPRWRSRSPKNIVNEIEFVHRKYHQNYFVFMDDNLTLSKEHILGICREIKDRKLDINMDCMNGVATYALDEEVLDAFVDAGLVRVSIAIESGSEHIRNQVMHKGLATEKILDIARITKKYKNLRVNAFFILGMPEETPETIRHSEELMRQIDVDEIKLFNAIPFPGTELYAQAVRDNLLLEPVAWDRTFMHTGNKRFFIKPYAMSIEQLNAARGHLDDVIAAIRKEVK